MRQYISSPTEDENLLVLSSLTNGTNSTEENINQNNEWPNFPPTKIIDFSVEELPESGYISLLYYIFHGTISGNKVAAIKDLLEVFFSNEKRLKNLYDSKEKQSELAYQLFKNRIKLIDLVNSEWK